jgi:hypothetical protein
MMSEQGINPLTDFAPFLALFVQREATNGCKPVQGEDSGSH